MSLAGTTPSGANKRQFVSFEKLGIRHVREVLPGEDAQEVLSRPTPMDLKNKRTADEQAQIEQFANYETVSAYMALMKPELKARGLRYPMEKYRAALERMKAEAAPVEHAVSTALRKVRDTSPNEEELKPYRVCPKCNQGFKRLDLHVKHCQGPIQPAA